jgi:ABC-type amino acid transport substrate-binding protein
MDNITDQNQVNFIPPSDRPDNVPTQSSSTSSNKTTSSLLLWGILIALVLLFIGGLFYALRTAETRLEQETNTDTNNSTNVGPNVQRILDRGSLIVGTDATSPPMEFLNADGELSGYDVDLANRIAQELGVIAKVENIAWDDVFDALLKGKIDVILSSVTINDERKKIYLFSSPYINAGQVIVTRKTTTDIKTIEDLVNQKIGVQSETTNETEALKHSPREMVIGYPDFNSAADGLVNNEVDVILADLTLAKGIVDTHTSLQISGDPFTSEFYGVVMRKGEDDLKTKIDSIIEGLQQRGILVYLKQKWLE